MKGPTVILCVLGFLVCSSSVNGQGRRKRPQGQRTSTAAPPPGSSEDGVSEVCPEPNGFFADAYQCDKYYQCIDGKFKEKLCADGLAFIDAGPNVEKCEFMFAVDCTGRPELQPPQTSMHCPRKNGYYPDENEKICNKFYYCVDGSFNAITCPDGLVFSNKTGTCTWPDEAKKKHCSSGELFEFECPKREGELEAGQLQHPRFADPKDCQFFYVCIDGKTPRRNGCGTGTVFNEKSGQCDKPKNVPECKDWYKGILDYDEDGEIVTSTPKPRAPGATGTKRKVKRPPVKLIATGEEV